MKNIPASGQYLVSVSLVSDVPDNPVVRGVENIVQGNGQFNRSETGTQVSGIFRKYIYNVLTQLCTYLAQFFGRQLTQILRIINDVQYMFILAIYHVR